MNSSIGGLGSSRKVSSGSGESGHNASGAGYNKSIEASIDAILEETIHDAQCVGLALKQYACAGTTTIDVSDSVKELQKIDIFVQKLAHIKRLHEIAVEHGKQGETASAINRDRYYSALCQLNGLQATAAAYDYHTIVTTLTDHLDAIRGIRTSDLSTAPYFKNRNSVADAMSRLSAAFSNSARAEHHSRDIDAETWKALDEARHLYSMESERFVLDWLMSNTEGTSAEMLEQYSNLHTAGVAEGVGGDIELF